MVIHTRTHELRGGGVNNRNNNNNYNGNNLQNVPTFNLPFNNIKLFNNKNSHEKLNPHTQQVHEWPECGKCNGSSLIV